ncbi:hypothetical protein J8N05_06310 [Streptomyces sp. BH-SS-21]|uniref:Uncharacterized protein n=1 Tax=Streptomyces liliiviolaceus TaxID=2823109 RepID=A0A941B546_9ACTN|nr:hypothetical protein [Streptomyces liliiviolaceus]MBQ0847826.1 hypothetical protein [Streptomyces liliiviolaceus]
MGRRTGWWRGRTVLAGAAALLSVAVPAGQATTATAADAPPPYRFAVDAERIEGADQATDAESLTPGTYYRSTVPDNGKLYYGLRLDEASTASGAYVSATAVPKPGTKVRYSDGIKVSLQDPEGHRCFSGDAGIARFGPTESPRPITAWASRRTGPGAYICKGAGTYSVLVERTSGPGSSLDDWELELQYVSEPALGKAASTAAPQVWDSASPQAFEGPALAREGGTGFSGARSLEQGVWKDGIRAGQTLFYRVPVDWGQQLDATAELGPAASGDGYLGNALVMSLHNPVRALVDDADTGYDGTRKQTALRPLPPVAYENRFAVEDQVGGMRFAGWYYLVVHLAAEVSDKFGDGPFALTLHVRVKGTAQEAPAYSGAAVPRDVFEVTAKDKHAAASGSAATGGDGGDGGSAGENTAMKAVAVGGIGTGCVLVLGLAMWTVIARRRAGAGTAEGAAPVAGGGVARTYGRSRVR